MKKIIIIIMILLLSGCYNYKELNRIAIVSSISIDKKDDKYLVGAQVMNIKTKEETESSKVIVYESTGNTIEEALRKMTNKSNKKLYGGHLSKLVISEEIAKEGIIDVIDLFQRLPEIKDEFTITIVKGIDANKVIKIMTSPESIPADYVKKTIETANLESALTYNSKLDEFVSYYLKDYIDPVISVLEVKNYNEEGTSLKNNEDTNPNTKIELDKIAITHNGKLEKYLNKDQTIGYNFINNSVDKTVIPIKCDKNNYVSISLNKSKTKYKIKKKDKYIIYIDIKSNGSINEYNCSSRLNNEKTINTLQKKVENKVKYYVNEALKVRNNSKSEFLGLKRKIYLDYPKYNNEDYDIKLNIDINLARKGEIRNSSKGEKYEH